MSYREEAQLAAVYTTRTIWKRDASGMRIERTNWLDYTKGGVDTFKLCSVRIDMLISLSDTKKISGLK